MAELTVAQVIETDIRILEGMRLPVGEVGAIQAAQRVIGDLHAVMEAFRRDVKPAEPEREIEAEVMPAEG